MKKIYNQKNEDKSSCEKYRISSMSRQKSLLKLKQRSYCRLQSQYNIKPQRNQKISQQYLTKDNKNANKPRISSKNNFLKQNRNSFYVKQKNTCYKDAYFQNQLKTQIQNITLTLNKYKQYCNYQEDKYRYANLKQQIWMSMIYELKSEFCIPEDMFQLVQIQQKIKDRNQQISKIKQEISVLKHQFWRQNIHKENLTQKKVQSLLNFDKTRFILADQVKKMNKDLTETLNQYGTKYSQINTLRLRNNQAYKDASRFHKVISYQEFKEKCIKREIQNQLQLKKDKYNQQYMNSQITLKKQNSHNLQIPSSNHLKYSNISNISNILPSNFIQKLIKRQFLPGQIPSLPKQANPTLKSLNLKKKTLKQALKTQLTKHQKDLNEYADKIMFLYDQDQFLSEQIDNFYDQINGLQQKFSFLQIKSKTPTRGSSINNRKANSQKQKQVNIPSANSSNRKSYIQNLIQKTPNKNQSFNQSSIINIY